MTRRPVTFGSHQHLFGILHLPEHHHDVAMLMWNTGISNRTGPFRLAVALAELCPEYPFLRFDLAGLGDSDHRPVVASAQERNRPNVDVVEAMDFLQQNHGIKRFILMGICSGAVDAHDVAAHDTRVVGLVMVDGIVYRTPQFYLHFYLRRLLEPRRILRSYWQKVRALFGKVSEAVVDSLDGVYPDVQEFAGQVQGLVDRGVPMYVAFTGGFAFIFSYRDQYRHMIPGVHFAGLLQLKHYVSFDHLFSLAEHRQVFFQDLRRWLDGEFKIPQLLAAGPQDVVTLLRPVWTMYATNVAVAGEVEGESLTYAALEVESRLLAQHLKGLGIGPSDVIGICMSRSPRMIVAVLAVLRSGAAYAPLDPAYPQDRLDYMMDVAKIRVLLLSSDVEARFTAFQGQRIVVGDLPSNLAATWEEAKLGPHDLAYVIFTSGSSGKPKGVAMGHGALTQLIVWQQEVYPSPGHRTLQFTPLSFDVSFQEIFATLAAGGTLVIIQDEQRLNPYELLTRLDSQLIERLYLPYVALQLLAEMAKTLEIYPHSLRDVFTAGEQLKITDDIRHFFQHLNSCRLHNHYGPSETHVVTALTLEGSPASWPSLPSIGQPIKNSYVYILDPEQRLVAPGEVGELYLAGACLAEGYIHRPDLTAGSFIRLDRPELAHQRLYRTGDTGRLLPQGHIELLGRMDAQVKIRGYRIELGEIEAQLESLPQVAQAIVQPIDTATGERALIAYIVAKGAAFDPSSCKATLAQALPDYMLPQHWQLVSQLPRTPSGKVDRKALPPPQLGTARKASAKATAIVTPTEAGSSSASLLLSVFREVLKDDAMTANDSFFDRGGTSILAMKVVALLKQRHAIDLPITRLFEHSSAASASQATGAIVGVGQPTPTARAAPAKVTATPRLASGDIAVIGMACKVPGADDTNQLWHQLLAGFDGTSAIPMRELHPSVDEPLRQHPDYVRRRGLIADAAGFDAEFFKFTPKDAELLDPQQRLFLELAWIALEDAGLTDSIRDSQTAVYAGTAHNSYYVESVLKNFQVMKRVGAFQAMLMNDKDYVATRLAFALNLKGPAVSVHTACSTSLVAVTQAVLALRAGTCSVAICGGVSVQAPQRTGYLYQEGGIYAKDGVCRPFSADATGTFFSDGGGVVILKPLEAALADSDRIYGVIKGVGINNDGHDKSGFSAPSVSGQAACLSQALGDAGIEPDTVSYVECHGTATPIGDPIEVEALARAYRIAQRRGPPCHIGSIKSNIGHLTAASGVVGLIKTLLALKYRTIPASVHFGQPNPLINFHQGALQVVTQSMTWPGAEVLRAGVSSFGFGGTNAHVIIESAPAVNMPTHPPTLSAPLYLSATTANGLGQLIKAWDQRVSEDPGIDLQAAAMSTQVGRQHFAWRTAISTVSRTIVLEQLRGWTAEPARQVTTEVPKLAMMFPGQGSQYVGMGLDLWQHLPPFRTELEALLKLAETLGAHTLRALMLSQGSDAAAMQQTRVTQPALYVLELALAKTLKSFGLVPQLLLGHSVGEIVAATLSGIFTEVEALDLVIARGQLMQELPPGAMLSVRGNLEQVQAILPPTLDIAAINSPDLCTVAGPSAQVQAWQQILEAKRIAHQPLHTSHAFHSRMMEPAIDPLRARLQSYRLRAPSIPVISSVTGQMLSDAEARDPEYWASHLRRTVNFAAAIRTLWQEFSLVLVESGPRQVCTTLALKQRQINDRGRQLATPMLSDRSGHGEELVALQSGLSKLWQRGIEWNASAFWHATARARITTPVFSFHKKSLWIEPDGTPDVQSRQVWPAASQPHEVNAMDMDMVATLRADVYALIEEASGIDLSVDQEHLTFLELGFDSLFLTQLAINLQNTFLVSITFRQLMDDVNSLSALLQYIGSHLPATKQQEYLSRSATHSRPALSPAPSPQASRPPHDRPQSVAKALVDGTGLGERERIVSRQLQIMEQQMLFLQGGDLPKVLLKPESTNASFTARPRENHFQGKLLETPETPATPEDRESRELKKKPFGAIARIQREADGLTELQRKTLADFTELYTRQTKRSKDYTQVHRRHMADPRVVTGFKPTFKELVYPLIVDRSQGCHLWDIDGNPYIDLLCGFGSNFFGNQADFIVQALQAQLRRGMEIGPQHSLVGDASRLACELTGFDRVAWCNTGSEAVLGALRIARTVTGRAQVVSFNGSYHGINDEVIVRGTKKLKPIASAPGIMPSAVQNMLVLDYGTEESLQIIRAQAHQLAAILVEPVQSRRPEFRPVAFLQELRKIATESGCVLIFDEVITGFRYAAGGVQQSFGIQADLGTYGKVVGGGMPIGMIAGRRAFMDALDGGFWTYGDASIPEVGVTYFAGTFVRHPLAIAAAHATLVHLKDQGPALQVGINRRADHLCQELNDLFKRSGAPYEYCNFGSLMKLKPKDESLPYQELLGCWLRSKGIHIIDGFPSFLTTAHRDEHVDQIIQAFTSSLEEMGSGGLLDKAGEGLPPITKSRRYHTDAGWKASPKVRGAKLGRDQNGNPAWFIEDQNNQGHYLMITDEE